MRYVKGGPRVPLQIELVADDNNPDGWKLQAVVDGKPLGYAYSQEEVEAESMIWVMGGRPYEERTKAERLLINMLLALPIDEAEYERLVRLRQTSPRWHPCHRPYDPIKLGKLPSLVGTGAVKRPQPVIETQTEPQDGVAWTGSNYPPPDDEDDALRAIDPEKLVDAAKVPDVLALNYDDMVTRAAEFRYDILAWVDEHLPQYRLPLDTTSKPYIRDEQDLKDTTDVINQIWDFITKEVEVTRKTVKKPIDTAGASIQAFFNKGLADPLKQDLQPLLDAQTIALRAKEERERQRLREEAYVKEQDANRLAIMARRERDEAEKQKLLDKAMKVEGEAARLQARSEASAAELSRTRTDLEEVTGLRSRWRCEVENIIELLMAIVAGQLDAKWVMLDPVYAGSKIRPKDGVRKVPGLRIYEETSAS